MSKRKLHERMALFNAGDWAQLLLESNSIAESESVINMFRTTFRRVVGVVGRVVRWPGRQAFEGSHHCPSQFEHFRDLTNPIRRLAAPHEPLHEDLTRFVPEHTFQLDPDVFLANVRCRRGVAARPSGNFTDNHQCTSGTTKWATPK